MFFFMEKKEIFICTKQSGVFEFYQWLEQDFKKENQTLTKVD